jgi:hypothetical protein
MPIDTHPARNRGRTPEQIVAAQKEQAAKDRARASAPKALATSVPAKIDNVGTAVAAPDSRTSVQKYVDEIAPAGLAGRLVKFGKEGSFITADDGEPVPETADFLALCDETLVGWIKFSRDDDTPPERIMGVLYDGWTPPARNTLGDVDQADWPAGLSGEPEDVWKHQICLVLQNVETRELYTFATTSLTGRRAVGNLLKHYDRMQRTNPGEVPIVRLKAGGFNHRDDRIGWVPVPVFAVVGRAPRDAAAKPDTSVAADLNDQIPI